MIASDTSLGKLYNLMLYIPQVGGSIYLGRRCWLDCSNYLIHYYHMSNQQFWRAIRIESIWFLNRACRRRIHELSRKNQNKIERLPSQLLRRKETSVYILLLLLCWPLSIRRRAASRRTTLVPGGPSYRKLLSWEYRRRSVVETTMHLTGSLRRCAGCVRKFWGTYI